MKRNKTLHATRFNEPATFYAVRYTMTNSSSCCSNNTGTEQQQQQQRQRQQHSVCKNTPHVYITSYSSLIPGTRGIYRDGLTPALAPRMPFIAEGVVYGNRSRKGDENSQGVHVLKVDSV